MSLSNLSVKQLEHAVKLLKEREVLQSKLNRVNSHLQHLEKGNVPVQLAKKKRERSVSSKKVKKRHYRRGGLQEAALKVLKKAGAKGLTVKELAAQAKINPASLSVWLYTRGKKKAGIKKVAPGRFAYVP